MVLFVRINNNTDVGGVILDHGRTQISFMEPDCTTGRYESVNGLYSPSLDIYSCRFSASANLVLQEQRNACDCLYHWLLADGVCHSWPYRTNRQVGLPYESMILDAVLTQTIESSLGFHFLSKDQSFSNQQNKIER